MITIKKTAMVTIEMQMELPAYFQFGPNFVKVIDEKSTINICDMPGYEGIEFRKYLTDNDWQPIDPAIFYERLAYVSHKLTQLSGIEYLEIEGGAYAD